MYPCMSCGFFFFLNGANHSTFTLNPLPLLSLAGLLLKLITGLSTKD